MSFFDRLADSLSGSPSAAPPASAHQATLLRAAMLSLFAHAALSAFSAFAFATFLAPPMPAWLNTPLNLKVYSIGIHYGGQVTVVLGALAGLLFLASCIGTTRAATVFAVSFCLSLTSELLGTGTGLPFGVYGYSELLGYKIGGLVPFNIPTSWFYMLVASLAICGRLLPAKDDSTSRWWWSLVAGIVLTAWDVSMDPAMVKTSHWMWSVPDLSNESAFVRFIGTPFFFGMPLTNWLGWLLTGILVARAMLALVPPSEWVARVAPSNLPLVMYGVNGLLPIAICLRQDMVLAGSLGTVAMAVPLIAAVWASQRSAAERSVAPTLGEIAVTRR